MHTSRTLHASGAEADQHPRLETLATFLDGKLPHAERAQVMKHLAACKACFSLFADTARTQRELEPAGGKVLRFPFLGRPAVRRVLPFAAAAVLVLAVGLAAYDRLGRPAPRMVVADLVAPLSDEPELSDQIWEEVVFRGEDEKALAFQARSFQVGARLVDFQLSVEAGNSQKAADAARRIANVLEQNGMYDEEVQRFRGVRKSLDERGSPRRYRDLVVKVTPTLEEGFGRAFTDFGKWTAAGRLSAIAGDPTFFERRPNRRFLEFLLEDLQRLDPKEELVPDLPDGVHDKLQRVANIWDAGPLDKSDYDEIAEALEGILKIYEDMPEEFGI